MLKTIYGLTALTGIGGAPIQQITPNIQQNLNVASKSTTSTPDKTIATNILAPLSVKQNAFRVSQQDGFEQNWTSTGFKVVHAGEDVTITFNKPSTEGLSVVVYDIWTNTIAAPSSMTEQGDKAEFVVPIGSTSFTFKAPLGHVFINNTQSSDITMTSLTGSKGAIDTYSTVAAVPTYNTEADADQINAAIQTGYDDVVINGKWFGLVLTHSMLQYYKNKGYTFKDVKDIVSETDTIFEQGNKFYGLDTNYTGVAKRYQTHSWIFTPYIMGVGGDQGGMAINGHVELSTTGMTSIAFVANVDSNTQDWRFALWHEIGHLYQSLTLNNGYSIESTANLFATWMEAYYNKPLSFVNDADIAAVNTFLNSNDPNKSFNQLGGTPKGDLGGEYNFQQEIMFWQLIYGFGPDFMPKFNQLARANITLGQSQQSNFEPNFIKYASIAANRNLTPFFQKWGFKSNVDTDKFLATYPKLTNDISRNIVDKTLPIALSENIVKYSPAPMDLQPISGNPLPFGAKGINIKASDYFTGKDINNINYVAIDDYRSSEYNTTFIKAVMSDVSGNFDDNAMINPVEITKKNIIELRMSKNSGALIDIYVANNKIVTKFNTAIIIPDASKPFNSLAFSVTVKDASGNIKATQILNYGQAITEEDMTSGLQIDFVPGDQMIIENNFSGAYFTADAYTYNSQNQENVLKSGISTYTLSTNDFN